MITSHTPPEKVSLGRQPIQIKLTSNLSATQNLVNSLRLKITGSPAVGEQLTITYADVSETFTVQTSADNSGTTLSVQGALSLSAYANLLVQELSRNYALYRACTIRYDAGSFDFIYLEPRTDLSQTWSFTEDLANIEPEVILGGVGAAFEPNPGLVLLVEKYNPETGTYEDPIPHDLPIIAYDEEVVFDVHKDFDLRHHLPPITTIAAGGDYFTACTDCIQAFRYSFAERSGRPSVVKGLESDKQDYFVLYAANSFFSQYADFWAYWRVNGRFLTTQSKVKTVTYDQPEWLYWIGRQFGVLVIRITATQRSGTVSLYNRGGVSVSLGDVVAVKTGYNQLNLPDTPDDPIVKYVVELTTGGSVVSEAFEYRITGNCGEYERYFLFGNSLGGCDTVRATGKFRTRIETTAQEARRVVNPAVIGDSRGQYFQYERLGRNTYEGSVGYRSAAYIAYLQELLLSPEVWLVDTVAQRFNPILIDTGTLDILKDGDDLYTLRFAYRHAWEEQGLGVTDDGQRIQLPPTNPDDGIQLGG